MRCEYFIPPRISQMKILLIDTFVIIYTNMEDNKLPQLSAEEIRVLGALIEKSRTHQIIIRLRSTH